MCYMKSYLCGAYCADGAAGIWSAFLNVHGPTHKHVHMCRKAGERANLLIPLNVWICFHESTKIKNKKTFPKFDGQVQVGGNISALIPGTVTFG